MPAAPAAKPINLAVEGTADFSKMFAAMQRMGTGWGKEMRVIEKQSDRATKGVFKDFHKMWGKSSKTTKDYAKLYEKTLKQENAQAEHLEKAWKDVGHEIKKSEGHLAKLSKIKPSWRLDDKQTELWVKANTAAIAKVKAKLVRLNDTKSTVGTTMEEFKDSGREGSETIKEKMELDTSEMQESAEKIGEMMVKPLEMAFRKDLPGLASGLFKGLGKGMIGGAKLLESAKAATAKKAEGMGGGAGAGAMKLLSKSLGGVANILKTIGPMLTMIGGAVMGLVQMFLEADAAAKDFNKEVMATSGSAEFLSKNAGDSVAATKELKSTLSDLYNQATAFDNVKWGITKEQYASTISALGAEGQSLDMLKKKYSEAGSEVKSFGDIVKTSVAYSSAFGVSLQEISQLQGEMMTELGSSFNNVESSFQYIVTGAEEAGIATNKFFEVIRGFSADLTMFTVRMDTVTHMMTALGKAMSPKNAEKFLHGIMGHFKGQGLAERTKAVLMGGGTGATKDRLQKSMDEKLGMMVQDMKGVLDDSGKQVTTQSMKTILKKDSKQLAKWLETNGAKLSEDQKKAIQDASGQQQLILKNNPVDLASALGDLDPMETLEQLEAQSMTLFGKKLEDLTGVERLGAEQAMGISDEDQKGIRKLNMGVERMQAQLVAKLNASDKLQKQLDQTTDPDARKALTKQIDALHLTEDEKAAVDKLAHGLTGSAAADAIEAKKAKEVWMAMSSNQKKNLKDGAKQIDYAKETQGFQTSITAQLAIMTDFLMGAFYNAIIKIKDTIVNFLGASDEEEKALSELERKAVAEGDKDMLKAIREGGGTLDGVKAALDKQWKDAKDKDGAKPEDLKKMFETKIAPAQLAVQSAKEGVDKASEERTGKVTGAVIGATLGSVIPGFGTIIGGIVGAKVGTMLGPKIAGWFKDDVTGGTGYEAAAAAGKAPPPKPVEPKPADVETGQSVQPEVPTAQETGQATADAMQSIDPNAAQASEATKDGWDAATSNSTIYTHDTHLEKLLGKSMGADEDSQEESEDQGGTLDDIWKALRMRGIKIDKPFLENSIKPVFRDAVYDAAGEALEDYYVLSQANPKAVLAAIKSGNAGKGKLGSMLNSAARDHKDKDGKTVAGTEINKATGMIAAGPPVKPNAAGGLVTGIGSDGMAQISPAPGEGLTSIGKGERISPAGGGGGGGKQVIELVLKGDLGRIIDVRAQNVVSNHETMKSRR